MSRIFISMKYYLKCIIGYLIQLIELFENKHKIVFDNKFIESIDIDEEVLSDTGFVHTSKLYKTIPYQVYRIEFMDGDYLECADNHILFDINYNEVFVKSLHPNNIVIGKNGNKVVKQIIKYPFKLSMYDLSVESNDHRYYTNNILSHNTTTISALFAWFLCFNTDKNAIIMANKDATAKEIVDKVIQIFRGLPYFLKPGALNFGKTGFSLDNGCNLISSPTTASASIGYTIHLILIDEMGHVPKNIVNPFWRSIYPTLSSSRISQCIICSTPNGMDNKFFEIWDKANRKENSFVPIRVDYWQVPGHDEKWAEEFKKDLGEEEFAQEFELQFNVSSTMLMKSSDLAYINKIKKPYKFIEIEGLENFENLKWVEGFNPNNISDQDYFLISVDTAEGKEEGEKKKDNDSNIVNIFKIVPNSKAKIQTLFNKNNIEPSIKSCFRLVQVGQYEDKFKDEAAAAKLVKILIFDVFRCGIINPNTGFIRDNCRLLIEMNFNGKNFLTHLAMHENYYEDVIISTYHTKPIPGETPKRKLGYKTTPSNKNYYCDKGVKLISNKIIIVNNEDALKQLSSFGKDKNGKYKGIACHDDIVMTILNLSRALEEPVFEEWLNNIFDNLDDTNVKYYINNLLERYAMDNPEMSDEQFNMLYGLNNNSMNISELINYYQPPSNPYFGK